MLRSRTGFARDVDTDEWVSVSWVEDEGPRQAVLHSQRASGARPNDAASMRRPITGLPPTRGRRVTTPYRAPGEQAAVVTTWGSLPCPKCATSMVGHNGMDCVSYLCVCCGSRYVKRKNHDRRSAA